MPRRHTWLWTEGGGGPAPFDPATVDLSVFFDAPYAGGDWIDLPSTGTSGGVHLAAGGTSPTIGAPTLNGYAPADFDGTSGEYFVSSNFIGDAVTSAAGSVVVIYKARTAAAPAANGYQDVCLFGLFAGGDIALSVNSDGVRAHALDVDVTSFDETVSAPLDAWVAAHARWNATQFEYGIGGVWQAPIAIGGGGLYDANYPTSHFQVGVDWLRGVFLDGQIARYCASQTTLNDADVNGLISSAAAKYGITL